MASLKQKTIKVAVNFDAISSISNNTLTTIGTPTIHIPENGDADVTFTSAMLYFSWEDTSNGSSGNGFRITDYGAAIALADASAATTFAYAAENDIVNSSENLNAVFGPIDFTAYFNDESGWDSSRTSQACTTQVLINTSTGTSTDFQKTYGWFEITYTYDADAGTSRIQTVCLPLESYHTYVPHSAATEFATLAQLTGAGGLLNGYNSPVIRQRWVEIRGSKYSGTNGKSLEFSFDGGTQTTLPPVLGTLASGTYDYYQIDTSGLDASSTHTLEMQSTQASRWPSILFQEWVTFEFTTTSTTKVLNYVELPIQFYKIPTVEASASVFNAEIYIPETNVTQSNCAVEINFDSSQGGFNKRIKAGSQSFKNYFLHGAVVCGPLTYQHRIDAGSSAGAGISLHTGTNLIPIELFQTSTARFISNVSGRIKLAYLSDVHPSGIDNHSQTVKHYGTHTLIDKIDYNPSNTAPFTASYSFPSGQDYHVQSTSINMAAYTDQGVIGHALTVYVPGTTTSIDLPPAEQREIYSNFIRKDSEEAYVIGNFPSYETWHRFPGDVDDTRLDPSINRKFEWVANHNCSAQAWDFSVTYHGVTHSISGSIANSSNGTSSLSLYQEVDDKLILLKTGSLNGDGNYNFSVYNSESNYQVSSYIDTASKELSKLDTPGTGFDIDYSSGGGGGEFFF
jgi:hypothetical protein